MIRILLLCLATITALVVCPAPLRAAEIGSATLSNAGGNPVTAKQVRLTVEFGSNVGGTPGIFVFNVVVGPADAGRTFSLSSGPEFEAAASFLTDGANRGIGFETSFVPDGGGGGNSRPESFRFFGDAPGRVDFAGFEITSLDFRIDELTLTESGGWTDYSVRGVLKVNGRPMEAEAGDLDPTYGAGGKVTTDFQGGTFEVIRDAAVQPDGKVVVVGQGEGADRLPRWGLARYKLDGSLDSSFGAGGKVIVQNKLQHLSAVIVQPDGKIVAAGSTATDSTAEGGGDFILIRFNQDGSLDTAFGSGGSATADFFHTGDAGTDVALQPDGKLVLAGRVHDGLMALARFNPDGSLDASFGDGGRAAPGLIPGGIEVTWAVAIQPDGKLVTAGSVFTGAAAGGVFLLARFNPDGSLDKGFGDGGKVLTDFTSRNDEATDVVIQPDGKIVAAGSSGADRFALARYNADGSLDSTFGNGGKVTPTLITGQAWALVLQPDGKLIVAGNHSTLRSNGSVLTISFAVARFNPGGDSDLTFGDQGKVITSFGESATAYALVLQPDGKLVAAGTGANSADFALARYLTSPTGAPVLRTAPGTNRAIALDSVTLARDPFTVHTEHNFAPDLHTRVLLFATLLDLLPGEDASAVTARAEDSQGRVFPLAVEHVGRVPGFEWLTQVTVQLPHELEAAGDVQVSVSLRGAASNKAFINIQAAVTP